jgi:hypothetical protein
MFSSDLCELHTKMALFAFAIGPVLDDSSCEEGTLSRECDHEFDFSVEIAASEAMGNVDADTRLTHIAGIQHVESSGTHDLNLDGRQTARNDTSIGPNRIQEGCGGETSHPYSIGVAPNGLERIARLRLAHVEVAVSLPMRAAIHTDSSPPYLR